MTWYIYCYFLALPLKRTKSDFITWVTSHCHYMAVKPIHNPFIQCYLTYCQSYVLLESTISTKTSFNLVLHGTLFQHGSVWLLICLIPDYFDTHANSSCTETMVQSVNIDACYYRTANGWTGWKSQLIKLIEKSIWITGSYSWV